MKGSGKNSRDWKGVFEMKEQQGYKGLVGKGDFRDKVSMGVEGCPEKG